MSRESSVNLARFFTIISTDRKKPWSASAAVKPTHLVSDFLSDHLTPKVYAQMGLEPSVGEDEDQRLHLLDPRLCFYLNRLVPSKAGSDPKQKEEDGAEQREWVAMDIKPGVVSHTLCSARGWYEM
jgi:hypothetical protein